MKQHRCHITPLDAGSIRMDGGQLFGLLAKQAWEKIVRADSANRVTLPARVLLVETPSHTILFDTGPGLFSSGPTADPSFSSGTGSPLVTALNARGIAPEQVSHIFLSHLHHNTAGGLFSFHAIETSLLFTKAKIHISKAAVQRACSPHLIDKALFIPGTGPLLKEGCVFDYISDGQQVVLENISISCTTASGHSPGMMIFQITRGHRHIFAGADLLPGMLWTDISICSNLERHPEKLAEEKQRLLAQAADLNAWIFYPHDPAYGFSKIRLDHRRRIHVPTRWCNTVSL